MEIQMRRVPLETMCANAYAYAYGFRKKKHTVKLVNITAADAFAS